MTSVLRERQITNMRVIFADVERRTPGPEASILKVRGTEIAQRISELTIDLFGAASLHSQHESAAARLVLQDGTFNAAANASAQYMNLRKLSIFGGSNEIQRNIIAQMVLGL